MCHSLGSAPRIGLIKLEEEEEAKKVFIQFPDTTSRVISIDEP